MFAVLVLCEGLKVEEEVVLVKVVGVEVVDCRVLES
jgi:hypothetical protein